MFLGLLERLEKLDGVSVVAACREFDLKYDPQLRAREWQAQVPLALLNAKSALFANRSNPVQWCWVTLQHGTFCPNGNGNRSNGIE